MSILISPESDYKFQSFCKSTKQVIFMSIIVVIIGMAFMLGFWKGEEVTGYNVGWNDATTYLMDMGTYSSCKQIPDYFQNGYCDCINEVNFIPERFKFCEIFRVKDDWNYW